jgi:hypothetical protein
MRAADASHYTMADIDDGHESVAFISSYANTIALLFTRSLPSPLSPPKMSATKSNSF